MKISECYAEYANTNKEFWKERTLETYNDRFKVLLKKFGDIDIDIITQEFLQEYITKEQKDNKRKSNVIRNELTLLFSIIRPYKKFDRFKYVSTENDLQKKKIYTEDDISKIQDYILNCKYKNRQVFMPIMIAINTGMRLSEIIGLKWEDIDFNLKCIEVKRNVYISKNGEIIDSLPKTKNSYRTIPLNDILFNYLLKFKPEDLSTFVITNTNKPKYMRSVQRTNENLLKRLEIKCLGFHSYRHSFATKLLKTNGDFKSISEILGHSNISITQNIYNHPDYEQKIKVIENAFEDNETNNVNNYELQIEKLSNEINELRVIVARLIQYTQDNLGTTRYKYKILNDYGEDKFYKNKKELIDDLDINYTILKDHLQGYPTLLNQIGVKVVEL